MKNYLKTSIKMIKQQPKKARRLKGFEDWFAEDMKIRTYVIETFKRVFEKYGYEPLETPALELSELMLGQSGEEAEKQYYRFKDPGGRDVMLRYEVMIAMCRAVGENLNRLPLPYKRYQIQRCWRAENTQKGRFREFTQCDADTIGSTSMLCDAEFIQMGLEIMQELGFKKFIARISNRKFLEGYAEVIGIKPDQFYGFCMSLDKLKKVGPEKVINEMVERRGIEKELAEKALKDLDTKNFSGLPYEQVVLKARTLVESSNIGNEGLDELSQIGAYFEQVHVDPNLYTFDTSLARGLASYTGPVWEFEVIDGGVGSIAGCGRYDKAIEKYVGKEIPATGGSFGIERISAILEERKMVNFDGAPARVLVTIFEDEMWRESLSVANELRKQDVSAMLYPEAIPLKKQFKFADNKEIPWVIVVGPDEVKEKKVLLKEMRTGEQELLTEKEAVKKLRSYG